MSILTKKAVLAALNMGGWDARKRDDKASKVVHKHFGATEDSGNFNKTLFDVKDDAWTRITKARSAVRDYHYSHTLGWVNKGAQLLPAATYLDYNSEIGKLIAEYLSAGEAFVGDGHYERLKEQAKVKRNGLYREDDYPTAEELTGKFYAEVRFLPVPDAGHVVVDLHNAEVKRIQHDTEAMVEQAVTEAQAELWGRLFEPVNHMAVTLANEDNTRFHDTLVTNVRDIVKLVEPMNLAGDPKLTAMAAEVKKHLTKASSDTLKANPDKREEQAKKAAELARKMRSLMPKAA